MGKGLGVFGNFNGKVGNVVGYALKNSNNKQTQGLRDYQPVVSNPRTSGQALQRMLIGPAQRFYKWLIDPVDNQPLMNHSFEGVEYGNKSRQEFMRMAMSQKNGPYIPKSVNYAIPGMYQISKGSLPPLDVVITEGQALVQNILTEDMSDVTNKTWGGVSQFLINNNSFLQDGDQLTFIQATVVNERYQLYVARVVLDTSSTVAIANTGNFTIYGVNLLDVMAMLNFNMAPANAKLAAATVVLSRRSGNSWLRSPQTMVITDELLQEYYSEEALFNAQASYQIAEATTTSSRYLNHARTRGMTDNEVLAEEVSHIVLSVISGVTTAGLTDLNGQAYKQGMTDNGQLVNIIGEHGGVILGNGSEASGTTGSGESATTVYLTPTILGTSNLPSVNVTDIRV